MTLQPAERGGPDPRVQAESTFRRLFGRPPQLLVRAPGRVNLLGAHVDYNDGWVLPAAIDRAVWLAAAPGREGILRVHSTAFGEMAEIDLAPPAGPPRKAGRSASPWVEYARGVAWALAETGRRPAGLDAVLASDLPVGAGLSSSAAVEVAFLLAWSSVGDLRLERAEAARLARRVENEYLDVQSGVMDQFASLHGEAGHVVLLDCRDLSWELLPVDPFSRLLVADTGVRRRLVEGGLNDRRVECQAGLAAIRAAHPEVAALRDVTPALLAEMEARLDPAVARRVRHVVEECARVLAGAALLRESGDSAALGHLMLASHASSRDLYEVSIPELDALVEIAAARPGVHGARLAGAGFGGCVTVLVEAAAADDVSEALRSGFAARFGHPPEILAVDIADGAAVLAP